MSASKELQVWLKKYEPNSPEARKFLLKVWNSIEYPSTSKYSAVLEYIIGNVVDYQQTVQYKQDELTDLWQDLNEFLSLKYSPGSISNQLKIDIVDTLVKSQNDLIEKERPDYGIQTFLTVLNHAQMISFFNTHSEHYGHLITVLCRSIQNQILTKIDKAEQIRCLLVNLKDFSHYNSANENYKKVFQSQIIAPLTELVIVANANGVIVEKEYFNLLTMMFFNQNEIKSYKEIFENDTENQFFKDFKDQHVCLLIIESFMEAYQKELDLMVLFYEYLFEKMFTKKVITDFPKLSQNLVYIFYLLKKYNINLHMVEIGDKSLMSLIGEKVTELFNEKYQIYTIESITLINQTIQLNPLILEHQIVKFIAQLMVIKKNTKVTLKYCEFLNLSLEMYKKLSRFQKMISKLLDVLKLELNDAKITKKLKRKLLDELPSAKLRKLDESNVNESQIEMEIDTESEEDNLFMKILNSKFETENLSLDFLDNDWDDLVFAWPKTVATRFIQSISGLVSNTSLTIWKALLFSADGCLEYLEEKSCDENSVFYLQFVSYLLCQYLTGCHLVEQSDKNWSQIEERISQTKEKLQNFAKVLFGLEHNSKVMNSFLNVCLKLASFELTYWYYRPDSIKSIDEEAEQFPDLQRVDFAKNAKHLLDYVSKDDWTLLEERVTNFSKDSCKSKINSLNLLKIKALRLFDKKVNSKKENIIVSDILLEFEQAKSILLDHSSGEFFTSLLDKKQKMEIINSFLNNGESTSFLKLEENSELVNLAVIICYNKIAENIGSKKALISKIDFDKFLEDGTLSLEEVQNKIDNYKHKNIELNSIENVTSILNTIKSLPIGFLSSEIKNKIYVLNTLLLAELNNYPEIRVSLIEIIRLLHELGYNFDSFDQINLKQHLKLISNFKDNKEFYEIIINSIIKISNKSNMEICQELVKTIQEEKETYKDLMIITAERFAAMKKINRFVGEYQKMKTTLCELIFETVKSSPNDRFLIDGFIAALIMTFQVEKPEENEEIGKICLDYLKSKDGKELRSEIQLLALTLKYMQFLKVKIEDMEEVLSAYWSDIKQNTDLESLSSKVNKEITNLISMNYSTEKYMDMLKEIEVKGNEAKTVEEKIVICRLLQNFGECRLPKGKGVIFSEYFKQTLYKIVSGFNLKGSSISDHPELAIEILKCYSLVTKNVQVLMSESLFYDILSFPLDVNIKRLKVNESNIDVFKNLHNNITELCQNIAHYRSTSLRHVVPQFVMILKDLVHAICAYRKERSSEKMNLTENEIAILTDLAHGLEQVFEAMSQKSKNANKIAPFLLVYVINEMTFNVHSTTLYPNIKTHINNICYNLIQICDPNYGHFILRGCSEASRDMYKTLLKEYEKYYKFQGKI